MKTVARCLAILCCWLALSMPTRAASGPGSWSELVASYHTWRSIYSIMAPTLNVALSEIEDDIAAGTYAFAAKPDYYWDLTGWEYHVEPSAEIA